ncbi:MAG: HD family hydrolase [Anaerolineae bacterium]|nr:HD family hydrolase [Anaerolineae bacterium]
MDEDATLTILRYANQLKRTARTGWVQRGVPEAEDVAAHSYGVGFATLLLAELVPAPVDLGRALALAVLHDLPEALTTDIPSPAWRLLPVGLKTDVERSAIETILDGVPFAGRWLAWHDELALDESAEARLVHDADKIDLFVQALIYQEQSGNRHLQEFWDVAPAFHYAEAQAIYEALLAQRGEMATSEQGRGAP